MFAPGGGRRRFGGGHGGRSVDAYVVLLFAQLASHVWRMEHKPAVTVALMAGARVAADG